MTTHPAAQDEETPRTDERLAWCSNAARYKAPEQAFDAVVNHVGVMAEFARILERELALATAALEAGRRGLPDDARRYSYLDIGGLPHGTKLIAEVDYNIARSVATARGALLDRANKDCSDWYTRYEAQRAELTASQAKCERAERDAAIGAKFREMVDAGQIDIRNIMALFPNLQHHDTALWLAQSAGGEVKT